MRRTVLTLAAAAALVAPTVCGAESGGHATIVAALNAQRAANGLPAGVRENSTWSAKCAAHVAYMAAARRLTHVENSSSPWYTASGDWAGRNSVLAVGGRGDAIALFRNAPLHLIQLMSPELREVGVAADTSGYHCITTWPGYRAGGWSEPTVYTYPGDGAVGVPFAETASEEPFVPGDFVGLPQGAETGFNIMVFAEGIANPRRAHVVSATVTGPEGSVAVETVDRRTPTVGPYLPPGAGFVIPVDPLEPDTRYRATVRFAGGLSHTWSFATAAG